MSETHALRTQEDVSEIKIDRFNWFREHPKYQEMLSWGFEDTGQILSAFLVYLDLCEAKNWWHTELHPCRELQMAYITGRPTKKEDYRTILPLQTKAVLSPARLKEFLTYIIPKDSNKPGGSSDVTKDTKTVIPDEHRADKIITLAITDTDSTIVYYNIGNGLVSPDSGPVVEPVSDVQDGKGEKRGKSKAKGKRGAKRKADTGPQVDGTQSIGAGD